MIVWTGRSGVNDGPVWWIVALQLDVVEFVFDSVKNIILFGR